MTTQTLSPLPRQKFFGNDGKPLVGGKLFTYAAGTSTKLATYTDSTGGTPNANPVVLDFRGEANVWIPPNIAYKFVLAPADDTDPPGSPIWSVDQIVNSQLLTLFGGVDTGSTNNYILNFVANFTAYADGIFILWIPSNTNTGASTIDINGLGPIAIVNQDGTVLVPGQIRANQVAQIMYYNGQFLLLSNVLLSGSFTGTLTGMTGTVSTTVLYYISGNLVSLSFLNRLVDKTGTSNSTSMHLSGLPSIIQSGTLLSTQFCGQVIDNGAQKSAMAQVIGDEIYFFLGFDGTTPFTGSGTKGLSKNWNLIYQPN